MAKYFIIKKDNDDYNFYFSNIRANDIEEAFNIVYRNALDDLAEGLGEVLFDEQPNDFEDMEAATDMAYDMIKNQWNTVAKYSEDEDYVDCIDEDKEYGLLILNNKSKLWSQLQIVESLKGIDYKISNHLVDIILDNIRK